VPVRVVIRFHDGCKADILAWLARLPGGIEDRRLFVDHAVDELKRELARTTGRPPMAEYRDAPPPARYWWKYATDLWVTYTVTDSRGLFGARTRTIDVFSFEPVPPA